MMLIFCTKEKRWVQKAERKRLGKGKGERKKTSKEERSGSCAPNS
jgi:hypothetical protein